ncbi:MAG: hypothetical protein A2X69_00620 [Rhodobacteraceae bacterium GWF1_65_7]|nr:MAG: hypothetical protein A2X69_00620 [Rhodobacteraceae bacterium GWF1_65_7]
MIPVRSLRHRHQGREAPSNNRPKGYIRRFPSGALMSADPQDGYRYQPPFGMTPVQAQLCKAGDRITLIDGSEVTWSP